MLTLKLMDRLAFPILKAYGSVSVANPKANGSVLFELDFQLFVKE